MVWCMCLVGQWYLFDFLALTDVCAGGTDGFLLASFPLATRENFTIVSNSISLSDLHTLALNGPLMHTLNGTSQCILTLTRLRGLISACPRTHTILP